MSYFAKPQPTETLVKRLQRVARFLESRIDPDDADPDDAAKAAMRARANTCWQCAGRLEDSVKMADAAEMLWIVLANVSGGDWKQQSQEWQDAAARWRDNYFAAIGLTVGEPPADDAVGQRSDQPHLSTRV